MSSTMQASAGVMNRQFYPAGTLIFEEGDQGDYLYVVKSGRVEIFQHRPEGKIIIGTVGAGELFGEMALVDGEPRMASARTIQDCELMLVSGASFRDHLSETTPFIRAVMGILVKNLRSVDRWHNQRIVKDEDEPLILDAITTEDG
ncbi:MAG: Crp/Fnr family transcriptional regulator [Alphaproteobacteria bacterium]|nr:Crp/Fnr family transcriptional regulator [Alphaproteobacteria bacterium SS10]